jgi:multiple sugar transport system substrate-binding protein
MDVTSHREPNRLSRRQLLKQATGATVAASATAALVPAAFAAPVETSRLLSRAPLQDRVQILHWSHPLSPDDMLIFNPLIQRFQEAGNNVDVQIELVPWDGRIERKMSAAAAGTSPDTSYLNVDEFTTYAVEGALVELEGYLDEATIEDFLPGPQDAMSWEDHIYEIPVLHAFRVSYYNLDLWEASGLDPEVTPKTWEEIDAALTAILVAKNAGTHDAWPTASEGSGSGPTPTLNRFNPWFYQSGGSLINEDGTSGYNSEAGIEAATWATHLFQTYCSEADLASTGTDRPERFGQGRYVWENNDELGRIRLWQNDFPDLNFGIANTPTNLETWTHGGVGCYGIWTPSDQRDATWAWIAFLTGDGNVEFNDQFGFVPPRNSVREQYMETIEPIYARALEEQQYAGVEKHPRLWDMWDIISPELQAAFAGSKTPEDAMNAAAERINSNLLG